MLIRLVGTAISVAVLTTSIAWSQTAASGQNQDVSQQQSGSQPQSGSQNQQTGETQAPQTVAPSGRPGIGTPGPRSSYYDRLRERPWFSDRGVREQLGINDTQYDQLNQSYSTAWRRYNQNVRGLGTTLSEERRIARMRALQDEFDRDFSSSRDATIRDERLRNRFNQLNYQYRGYESFNDPTVQTRLSLTPQQRRRLAQYNQRWNRDMERIAQVYSSDPDVAAERYRELQKQSSERLGTVFTPEQRRQWEEFIGEPYDYAPDSYFYNKRDARNATQPPSDRTNPQ